MVGRHCLGGFPLGRERLFFGVNCFDNFCKIIGVPRCVPAMDYIIHEDN